MLLKKLLKKKVREVLAVKFLSVMITASLLLTCVSGWANAMPAPAGMLPGVPAALTSINTNIIPFNVGHVTESLYNGQGKVLVTIQDLHSHKQTQENINSILKILDKKYGIKNIWLEGASGQLDTSWITNIKDKDLREKTVNTLLNKGRLTGGELFSIQSGRTDILKGLENREVYLKNFERLNEIYNNKKEIQQYLPQIRAILNARIEKYFSAQNKKINSLQEKNKSGEIKADRFFNSIIRASKRAGIDLTKYDQIVKYLYILNSQKYINFEKVKKEISEILKELKNVLTYQQYKTLLDKVNNKETETEFYKDIKRFAEEKGILGKYEEAASFFGYIEYNDLLNPIELARQEDELVNEIETRFAQTGYELEVLFLKNYFRLIENYLNNKITADEYGYFENNKEKFKELWIKYVDADGIIDINKYFSLFDDFYKDNVERNRYFIENVMGYKPAKEKEAIRIRAGKEYNAQAVTELEKQNGIDVIITGGFHTQGLSKLLEEEKINYIVITPNVTDETVTSERLYEEMFKEEYEIVKEKFANMPASAIVKEVINRMDVIETVKLADGKDAVELLDKDGNVLATIGENGTINGQPTVQSEEATAEDNAKLNAQQAELVAKTFLELQKFLRTKRENARLEETAEGRKDTSLLEGDLAKLLEKIENVSIKKGFNDKLKSERIEIKGTSANAGFTVPPMLAAMGLSAGLIALLMPFFSSINFVPFIAVGALAIIVFSVLNRNAFLGKLVGAGGFVDSGEKITDVDADTKNLIKEVEKAKKLKDAGVELDKTLIDTLKDLASKVIIKNNDSNEQKTAKIEALRDFLEVYGFYAGEKHYDYRPIDLIVFELQTKAGFGLLGLQEPSFENRNITPYSVYDGKSPIISYDYLQEHNEAKNIQEIVYMYLNGGLGESVKGREPVIFALKQFKTIMNAAREAEDTEVINILSDMAKERDLFGRYLTGDQLSKLEKYGFVQINPYDFYDENGKVKKEVVVNGKKISVPALTGKATDTPFVVKMEDGTYEYRSIMDIKMAEMANHNGIAALQIVGPGGEANATDILKLIAAEESLLEATFVDGALQTNGEGGGILLQERYYSWKKAGEGENQGFSINFDNINPGGHGTVFFTLFSSIIPKIRELCKANGIDIKNLTKQDVEKLMKQSKELFFGNGDGLNSAPTGRIGAATMTTVPRTDVDAKGGMIVAFKVKVNGKDLEFPYLLERGNVSKQFQDLFARYGLKGISREALLAEVKAFREKGQDKDAVELEKLAELFKKYGIKETGEIRLQAFNTNGIQFNNVLMGLIFAGLIDILGEKETYKLFASPTITSDKGSYTKYEWAIGQILLWGNMNLEILRTKNPQVNNLLNTILGENKQMATVVMSSPEQREEAGFTPFKFVKDILLFFKGGFINAKNKFSFNKGTKTDVLGVKGTSEDNLFSVYYDWAYFDNEAESFVAKGNISANHVIVRGKVELINESDKHIDVSPELFASYGNYGFVIENGKVVLKNVTVKIDKNGNMSVFSGNTEIIPTQKVEISSPAESTEWAGDVEAAYAKGSAETSKKMMGVGRGFSLGVIFDMVEKASEWFQLQTLKIVSLFKAKTEVIAVVNVDDDKAMQEAKELAESGVKVKLYVLGDYTEVSKRLKDLMPVKESGNVIVEQSLPSFELRKVAGNLEVIAYTSEIGRKQLGIYENVLNEILLGRETFRSPGKAKAVIYLSESIRKSQRKRLSDAETLGQIVASSSVSIKDAIIQGLLSFWEDKKVNMIMQVRNIYGSYSAMENEQEFLADLRDLKEKRISNVLIDVTGADKVTVERKVIVARTEGFNNIVLFGKGSADMKIDGTEAAVTVKEENKRANQSRVVEYSEAIAMKGNDFVGLIVRVARSERENLVVTPEDINRLIANGAAIAFDGEVLREVSKEKTAENGLTMLDIVKAMFAAGPEEKERKGIRAGRDFMIERMREIFDVNLINKETEALAKTITDRLQAASEDEEVNISGLEDKIPGIEKLSGRERRGMLLGILQTVEFVRIVGAEVMKDDERNRIDIHEQLLERLAQYRLLTGKSYEKGDYIGDEYKGKTPDYILNKLEMKYEQEVPNPMTLAGIIEVLLSDMGRMQLRIDGLADSFDTRSLHAMLAAA